MLNALLLGYLLTRAAFAGAPDSLGGITVGQPVPTSVVFSKDAFGHIITRLSIGGLTMRGSVTTCGTVVDTVAATAWWWKGAVQYGDQEVGHMWSAEPLKDAGSAFKSMMTKMESLGWRVAGSSFNEAPSSGGFEVETGASLEKDGWTRKIHLSLETSSPEDQWARLDIHTVPAGVCTEGL